MRMRLVALIGGALLLLAAMADVGTRTSTVAHRMTPVTPLTSLVPEITASHCQYLKCGIPAHSFARIYCASRAKPGPVPGRNHHRGIDRPAASVIGCIQGVDCRPVQWLV